MELSSPLDVAINTPLALEFHKLAANSANQIFIHPSIKYDLERDANRDRAEIRRHALRRFNEIKPSSPPLLINSAVLGNPADGTNDWVDNQLLLSLVSDAVDYLVTEDVDIHRKAKQLGSGERVLYLADAISILKDFFDTIPPPPPAVQAMPAYQLDVNDPIFDSLKVDYQPKFDAWFSKCKREQRPTYVVKNPATGKIAGLCIVKPETALPDTRNGKVLKLCTFKVSPNESGNRYGELLLKTIVDFLAENQYEYTYFTVFPRHQVLIEFAEEFGFYKSPSLLPSGEIVMVKELIVTAGDRATLSSYDLHIKYGPRITSFDRNSTFVVPIKPVYHKILFPECEEQALLIPDIRPCGNSIRKSYISSSRAHSLNHGDNIVFYRSEDWQRLSVLGIIDNVLRSNKHDEIIRHVGRQTVYTYSEIEKMCESEVLAINFRLVRMLGNTLSLRVLRANGVLNGAPQSITKVSEKGIQWLRLQLGM